MATLRELKGRIGSVASSEKITGAMKMISSAKMHKAEQALKRLLPYRTLIEGIIGNLLDSDAQYSSPLTAEREVERRAVVVWGSDDGLCGAYNVNLYKQLAATITRLRAADPKVELSVIAIGSKMAKACRPLEKIGIKAIVPEGVNSKSDGAGVKTFLETLTGYFTGGVYDAVDILYMSFKSVSRQRPVEMQFLPVAPSVFAAGGAASSNRPCLFEPSAQDIFTTIVPMYLLAVLQDVFTENRASEMAARVMAMQSANDNAQKLLEQLRLEYNKLRQQSITTELLDIVGGQVR